MLFTLPAQTKHYLGEQYGGGIVFMLSRDSAHGVIAEIIDQGICSYISASNIASKGLHSAEGNKYNDWRLPTRDELDQLYKHREIIGGFTYQMYWSSTLLKRSKGYPSGYRDDTYGDIYCISFSPNGYDSFRDWAIGYNDINYVRAVRTF
ncbi:MAG: hypothetical protein U0W24_24860 [Bacteroidales bacterium]